ncbi:beta-mannanase man5E [Thalassomonas haliotis]|uniref:mannan endo-1,4-beta-mannosidase n=1 Tax=Thalassomonas haliotis TaxID=485448 RepID=A0ABY7VCJ3_9GAMM|nr:beta-mannanase man5E [Thalassomonas haliotis]WDE11046.1 beta-mannanase man5E [Thalassomonas haliotis]
MKRFSCTAKSTLFLLLLSGQMMSAMALEHFITRDGHRLLDGQQEFRFAGIQAPELHRIEDDARGKCAADPRGWGQYFKWPTALEQENWIKALSYAGFKAMRTYVLSVEQEFDAACDRDTHIQAPLTKGGLPRLNETAMVHYDRMIALADKYNLRLILPFIDHWEWWGGRKQLAAFYGEKEQDFYDINSKTYAAYLSIIEQVINRKNTLTGRLYKDEKAIMSWETGNEIFETNKSFLNRTSAFIKQQDSNHLVMDGSYIELKEFALNDPNVDIISNHYYANVCTDCAARVLEDLTFINGRKAYFVGEFGLLPGKDIAAIMQSVVHSQYKGAKSVGGLLWGFRGHRQEGGFYWHQDYEYFSYHLPGFPEGEFNEEQYVIDAIRLGQAQMDGLKAAPPLPVPEPPLLLPINSKDWINWMGSPLGRFYRIERATSPDGPWYIVGNQVSDGENGYDPEVKPLFSDKTGVKPGKSYFYRVIASNESGESAPSNVVQVIPVSD